MNYKDDYIDQGEVLKEIGMNYRTFVRYCQKIGLQGYRDGRCVYYTKQQIEMFKNIFTEEVKALIRIVEKKTGKTLILEDINLNKKETPLDREEMDVDVRLVRDRWYQPKEV